MPPDTHKAPGHIGESGRGDERNRLFLRGMKSLRSISLMRQHDPKG